MSNLWIRKIWEWSIANWVYRRRWIQSSLSLDVCIRGTQSERASRMLSGECFGVLYWIRDWQMMRFHLPVRTKSCVVAYHHTPRHMYTCRTLESRQHHTIRQCYDHFGHQFGCTIVRCAICVSLHPMICFHSGVNRRNHSFALATGIGT